MEDVVKKLREISRASEELNNQMRREHAVAVAELEERLALGLHGDAAIEHYNTWMMKYGLQHLMVNNNG